MIFVFEKKIFKKFSSYFEEVNILQWLKGIPDDLDSIFVDH